ncbi:MAG: radical SAM protein, partial [Methanomicrobiales archaeon]|nr:radical SAM protein [Methanomicrobiales archaeon]
MPFDPLERARQVEETVMKDGMRKYYRFRASRHYGGIVTADAVGCCFLCAYCWNYRRNLCPGESGTFYAPRQVVEKLRAIGASKGIRLFRVSGAEPVLGEWSFHHLLEVLQAGRFIIETNGLILGHRPDLVDFLVQRDVSVRVSIKGWNPESFQKITGARGEFFSLPIHALARLEEAGVEAWPAVMGDLFGRGGVEEL